MNDFCFHAWQKVTKYKEKNFAFSPYSIYCGLEAYHCLFEGILTNESETNIQENSQSLNDMISSTYSIIMATDSNATSQDKDPIPPDMVEFSNKILPILHIIGKTRPPTHSLYHRLIEISKIWNPKISDSNYSKCRKLLEVKTHINESFLAFSINDDISPRFYNFSHIVFNNKLLSPNAPINILPNFNVDFSFSNFDQSAITRCNEVIQHKTGDRCSSVIPKKENEQESNDIDNQSIAVLGNGIYIKALWSQPFNREPGIFETLDGADINIEMLSHAGKYLYADLSDAEIIRIPFYRSYFAFYIILPKIIDIDQFCDIKSLINEKSFTEYLDKMKMTDVILKIPKFDINFGSIDVFTELEHERKAKIHFFQQISMSVGINGIESENFRVPPIHVQTIQTDEDTQIFNANHPFIFIIRDEGTTIPLIMGMYTYPTEN